MSLSCHLGTEPQALAFQTANAWPARFVQSTRTASQRRHVATACSDRLVLAANCRNCKESCIALNWPTYSQTSLCFLLLLLLIPFLILNKGRTYASHLLFRMDRYCLLFVFILYINIFISFFLWQINMKRSVTIVKRHGTITTLSGMRLNMET